MPPPGLVLCENEDGREAVVLDAAGAPVPAEGPLVGAAVNRTATRQDGAGLSLQASWRRASSST